MVTQFLNFTAVVTHYILDQAGFASSSSSLRLIHCSDCALNTPKQYPVSALKPNWCIIKVHLLHSILLPVAHKRLTQSTSFITVHLSEQFISSSLSSYMACLDMLPNFSPIIEISYLDISPCLSFSLVRHGSTSNSVSPY